MYPRCPRCGGLLYVNYDGYEKYLTCFGCAREFTFDMKPKRITPKEFKKHIGLKLTIGREALRV